MLALSIIAILAICLFAYYLLHDRNYWAEKGVPQRSKFSIGMGGNFLLKYQTIIDVVKIGYDRFKDYRYFGTYEFGGHVLVVRDPELIRRIGIKDFDHFVDHRQQVAVESDGFWAKNLFSLQGDDWRHMRTTLSPSFTSSKMKAMFHLMKECATTFADHFAKRPKNAPIDVDVRDAFTRYTNDIIASLAFGVACDSLSHRDNEFFRMGNEVTDFSTVWHSIGFFLSTISLNLTKYFKVRMFSKRAANFFSDIVNETLKYRKENNFKRQDMLQLLIDSNKTKAQADETVDGSGSTGFATAEEFLKPINTDQQSLTNEDITAQALIFFLGGFDSVGHLMNYLSYELALNPDIQERLIEEIDETYAQCNGEITYDVLMMMKYLDMVICEALRKYPTFPFLDRTCTKPYTIHPEKDSERSVTIEKGDIVWIPNYAIHHDADYYPQPEKFDPERFNGDNKGNIRPYTYLPFGVGPRNCIGSRFALLETKVLFVLLLRKFKFTVTKNTPIPLKFMKGNFIIKPDKPILLGVEPRHAKM